MSSSKSAKVGHVEHTMVLSAEELEEERQDIAVRRIQNAYRSRRGRMMLRAMIRANYVKIRNLDFGGEFLYKNKMTGEIREDKPKFLGDEDLPDPRDFKAPYGYTPDDVYDTGCALIVTVSEFEDNRITPLHGNAIAEHRRLEELLTHDFKCRFKDEEIISLVNPTMSYFMDSCIRLGRICKPGGFLFVYICTHVATIGGNPDGYFLFKDSNWKKGELARSSSVNTKLFCDTINTFSCNRKAMVLSVAHKTESKARFPIGKIYPPKHLYSIIADVCKCPVLGACNIGTNVADQLMHIPPPEKKKDKGLLPRIGSASSRLNTSGSNGSSNPRLAGKTSDMKFSKKKFLTSDKTEDGNANEAMSSSSDDEDEYKEETNNNRLRRKIKYKKYISHKLCPAVVLQHCDELQNIKKARQLRNEESRAIEPSPSWTLDPEKGFQITAPTAAEVSRN